ncbi:hypothetical protein M1403_01475 [Patescibacteria group bacterium]|nr:hypothetical protein [Patescibacteria group bacterium]
MIILYLLLLLSLGIYSYSQIDLNLTLFQTSWFLNFQHQMIQLGYFNRPLSTEIFIVLTILFSIFYFLFIRDANRLLPKNMALLVVAVAILGLISYPAFSHDIFNYIFDARIAVFHHANPYTTTALMYPTDTWTRFMNWTHRTYPYGPTFLPISVLFYFLGLNKFLLTLFWFKGMAVAAYVGSAYFIYKLAKNKGLVLFAFNPLIIYEGVVAGHMDIVMLFFAIFGYYLFLNKHKVWGTFGWVISVGIKYATAFQVPAFFINRRREIALIVLAYIGALAQTGTHELLPHYFIVPLGFSALLPNNKFAVWSAVIISLVLLLLRYYPFLSTGVWLPIAPLRLG